MNRFLIKHTEKFVVTDILIENKSIFEILDQKQINFRIDGLNALDEDVCLPIEYEKLFEDIFDLCNKLKKQEKHLLAANTATFLFERFAVAWVSFLKNGQHFIAIKLWNKLLTFTINWEKTNLMIHKGTPLGFLSQTYFSMGDSYSAFNCLYQALNEDINLGLDDPTAEYLKKAPSYLTVTLNPSDANFMQSSVNKVRAFINKYIISYNNSISKSFKIDKLDTNFLQRRDLEPLNFYFTNTIWTLYEYRRRFNQTAMKNDFALLKNPDIFFSLCLIINDLLNIINCANDRMGNAIERYMKRRGWIIKDINIKGIISDSLPNDVLFDLLNRTHPHHKTNILLQEACLLLAWNIRNFSGHNIVKQDIFAEKFDEILEYLLFCIFCLIEDIK